MKIAKVVAGLAFRARRHQGFFARWTGHDVAQQEFWVVTMVPMVRAAFLDFQGAVLQLDDFQGATISPVEKVDRHQRLNRGQNRLVLVPLLAPDATIDRFFNVPVQLFDIE
ncbi:hypothetical protein GW777_05705 [Candidatus Peregrinibacteria bacterium]|nr:hypothetical protein [bacterium]NCQ55783.1 hypothetical protein [Candidatus Parcubacteria bacterium]NCS67850.1 hypothetical protein [Candidatus Peregrinibacteria bacterium]